MKSGSGIVCRARRGGRTGAPPRNTEHKKKREMKTTVVIGRLLLLCLAAAPAFAQAERPERVKVLTYNIHNGLGMDQVRDYARIGRLIRRSGADVAAIQEADSATRRSAGRDVLGEVARAAGMRPLFGQAIAYDGGAYGIGILSRREPLAVRRIPLPGREEERLLLVAEFETYVLGCVHLSLTEEDRLASVATICAEAARSGKPFVLAGDWNARPDEELLDRLRAGGFRIVTDTAQPTFPADRPDECIDYIAVYEPEGRSVGSRGVRVVADAVASDHRPVEATLTIGR